MTTAIWNEVMLMPTARSVVYGAVDVLAQRLSQLILCPDTGSSVAVAEAVRAELLRRDFSLSGAYLPAMEGKISLEHALAELLGVPAAEFSGTYLLEDLSTQPGWPDVFLLEGFAELSDSSQERWLALLNRWSHTSQKAIGEGRSLPALFCVAKPSSGVRLPVLGEVCLRVNWWWGLPSALECRLLCRMQEIGGSRDVCNAWRECLLPSLAAGDIELFAELWPRITCSRAEIWDFLSIVGEKRGWQADKLHKTLDDCNVDHDFDGGALNGSVSDTRSGPPDVLRPLWLEGLLQFTPEHGCELHAAALAVLGQVEALEHRFWRAQAALVLPVLETHRHRICRDLTDRYGIDWPLQWHQPASMEELAALRDGPLACQWGYLETLLRSCNELRRERKILPFVSHCRFMRNKLAHYRPIEFADFKRLWNG